MAELPAPYCVAERRRETRDTWTLRLEPEGDAVGAFAPGQFAMLYAFGAGEAPISIAAIDGDALVHTIRAVGAVTRALCAAERIGVRGPFGTTWPVAAAEGRDGGVGEGGVGLPPLRPMIRALLGDRDRYGTVNVLYGGRSPDEL